MAADYTADGVREWLAEAPARQAQEDAIAAAGRARMATRGETMAHSIARWEARRMQVAARVMGRPMVCVEAAPSPAHAAPTPRRTRATSAPSMALPGFE